MHGYRVMQGGPDLASWAPSAPSLAGLNTPVCSGSRERCALQVAEDWPRSLFTAFNWFQLGSWRDRSSTLGNLQSLSGPSLPKGEQAALCWSGWYSSALRTELLSCCENGGLQACQRWVDPAQK